MSTLVALDTETTGLDPTTEDVFEVAAIDLDTGAENVWRIEPRPRVVEEMHPKAAEKNRYHERIADPNWTWDAPRARFDSLTGAVGTTLAGIRDMLDGAHIVGAVPDFDARHLTSLYRRFGVEPPRWHYHLIDVEAMAVGWLHGQFSDPNITLPWRSDDLSRACGVEPPSEDERHTALGDARWAARWYRTLTGEGA